LNILSLVGVLADQEKKQRGWRDANLGHSESTRNKMIFREATLEDIPQIYEVRVSVKENPISDLSLIPVSDCINFLTVNGKGWVCEVENVIVGFAIVDTVRNNVWALFIRPDFEKRGIGKELQRLMLDWFFAQTKNTLWLSTAPDSRAESFYRASGWKENGQYGKGEIKFEMSFEDWELKRPQC
jgi:GNAT superfamily N-acetyltransferase